MTFVVLRITGAVLSALWLLYADPARAQDKRKAEVAVQLGHSHDIGAVALSPDARLALSGSNQDNVKLWDVATGKEIRTFFGAVKWIDSGRRPVAFSPDGRFVLSGGGGHTMTLWDISTGKIVRGFARKAERQYLEGADAVAFSPDGRFALSGGSGHLVSTFPAFKPGEPISTASMKSQVHGTLTLWDVATGKVIRDFDAPYPHDERDRSKTVASAVFSSDGQVILSGYRDKTVKLWDVATGKELRRFEGHTAELTTVALSPDGHLALSGSNDNTARLWDVATGKELRVFTNQTEWVTSVAFSPDGRSVLIKRTSGGLELWEIGGDRRPLSFRYRADRSLSAGAFGSAVFSQDGRFVLSEDRSGMVLWNAATGEDIRSFSGRGEADRSYGRGQATFSPDGRTVTHPGDMGDVAFWDLSTGRRLRGFSKLYESIMSADGRIILSNDYNDYSGLVLLDTATGKELRRISMEREQVPMALSADKRFALCKGGASDVALWDLETGKQLRRFEQSWPDFATFSPDGRFVLIGGGGGARSELTLWETSGRKVGNVEAGTTSFTRTKFSPDSRFVLSADLDKALLLMDTATGAVRRFGDDDWRYRIDNLGQIVFSADSRFFLTIHSAGLVLWDTETMQRLHRFAGHEGVVSTAAISPDGRFVLSGGDDTTLKLWDTATGRELRTFEGQKGRITSVSFSPDARFAVSGSYDGSLRLWHIETGREVALMMSKGEQWLALTPEGFFSSSDRDTDMLAIVRDTDLTTIGQIHQSLFNPDLLREALAGDADGEVRRAAELVSIEKVLDASPPPDVMITSPSAPSRLKDDLLKVAARITDRGSGVGRIEWRVNGVTTAVTTPSGEQRPSYDVEQTLALDQGENAVEVIAYERRNLLASLPARAAIALDEASDRTKPTLHILAIGINAYADKGGTPPGSTQTLHFPPLTLAVNDAQAFAGEMQKAGAGLYGEVRVALALNTDATAAGLNKIIARMSSEINPRDTFVFFAAAHGYSTEGHFYLIPQDFQGGPDPRALSDRAISQDQLQDWVANHIKARRAIILLDTCESGALVSGYTRSRTDMPASEAAIGRLHEATGRPVLTAAASGKPAWEGYKGHGVFTFALMDALHRGDINGDGVIELSELVSHVQAVVPSFSAEVQGPTTEKGVAVIAARGLNRDRQSARFGSTGEDFAIVNRIP